MQQATDKALLKKYLNNTCTPSELQLVRSYLLRPGTWEILNELMAEESAAEWERETNQPVELDEQLRNWQSKFEQRKANAVQPEEIKPSLVQTTQPKIIPGFFKRNDLFKYAAILSTIILGIGIYTFNNYRGKQVQPATLTAKISMKEFSTVRGQRAKITLTDGTVVYMGAASTLKYPEQFTGAQRNISLEGEAFFEVATNPNQPFLIQTENIRTQVLGTSFKVNAIKGRPFKVQVATGKVRVDRIKPGYPKEQLAILSPGQQVTLKTSDASTLTGQVAIKEIEGWKNSTLVFKDQTIGEIAAQLERAYDVQFRFKNEEKAKEVVTVTLQDNIPLNQTLRALSAGAQFQYNIKGKNITIK
ncbi:FecR family protein [Pedobacter gandavensis]|uniref:DUF4974 domain-containing protein n=1 Tax=Pedobacter gandavensis TaxID=2679963 RepID=A0ABR6ESQ9_9SPHI|nr:FecR domain-containing protein [Pedobacter gandavensis]MBB2148298.1 DUF4974 domain-containing protein [Pedobacter gandavensis]